MGCSGEVFGLDVREVVLSKERGRQREVDREEKQNRQTERKNRFPKKLKSAKKVISVQRLIIHSMILTSFVTDVIKNAVGRPRPDLLARCKPLTGTPQHKLVTWEVCSETDSHTLHDGWRSFPSGHSSFAFSGLGFLALFLCGQMRVFRPRSDLGRCLLALSPLLAAAIIAISRCEDYR